MEKSEGNPVGDCAQIKDCLGYLAWHECEGGVKREPQGSHVCATQGWAGNTLKKELVHGPERGVYSNKAATVQQCSMKTQTVPWWGKSSVFYIIMSFLCFSWKHYQDIHFKRIAHLELKHT